MDNFGWRLWKPVDNSAPERPLRTLVILAACLPRLPEFHVKQTLLAAGPHFWHHTPPRMPPPPPIDASLPQPPPVDSLGQSLWIPVDRTPLPADYLV